MRSINKLGSKLLETFVPRLEANASTADCITERVYCGCRNMPEHGIFAVQLYKNCVTCGGTGGCGPCVVTGLC